jgi:hypothetical protein
MTSDPPNGPLVLGVFTVGYSLLFYATFLLHISHLFSFQHGYVFNMTFLDSRLYGRADNRGQTTPSIPISPLTASHSTGIKAVCIVCLVVSWIVVLMRLWTRAVITRQIGYDDIFIFIAIVSRRPFFTRKTILIASGLAVLYDICYFYSNLCLRGRR